MIGRSLRAFAALFLAIGLILPVANGGGGPIGIVITAISAPAHAAVDPAARGIAIKAKAAAGVNTSLTIWAGDSILDTYDMTIDSTQATIRNSSIPGWENFFSGQQAFYTHSENYAIGGHTACQQAYTDNGGIAAVLAARRPGFLVWEPATNDIGGGASAAQVEACTLVAIKAAAAIGTKVILVPVMPRGSYTDLNSTTDPTGSILLYRKRQNDQYNIWEKAVAFAYPNVRVADNNSGVNDPSRNDYFPYIYPTYNCLQSDNLHIQYGCAPIVALAIWKAEQSFGAAYLAPIGGESFDAAYNAADNPNGNRITSQQFYGQSTAVNTGTTGTYPSGWPIVRSSGAQGTEAGSRLTTRTDGNNGSSFQAVVTVPTAEASINEVWRLEQTISSVASASVATGPFEFRLAMKITNPINVLSPSITAECMSSANGSTVVYTASDLQIGGIIPNMPYNGILKTVPFYCPAGTSNVRLRINIGADGSSTANGGTFQIDDAYFGTPVDPTTIKTSLRGLLQMTPAAINDNAIVRIAA